MKRKCGSWTIVRSFSVQVFTAYTLDLNFKKKPTLKRDKSTMFHNKKNELLEPVRGKQFSSIPAFHLAHV